METKKRRVEHVDTMRGVCLLLVNYFHSGISLAFYQYVANICVHPFFFMAGYFFSDRHSLGDICRKKTRTMLFPYYVLGLGYYLLWLLAFAGQQRDIVAPLRAVLYMPTDPFPIEPSIYFLPLMFGATMIFALVIKCVKPEWLRCAIFMALTYLGNRWTELFDFRLPMSLDCSLSVIIYFYLGYHGRAILNLTDKIAGKINSRFLSLALFFALAVVNYICIVGNFISNLRNGVWSDIPYTHLNTCVTMLLWVYFFRWFEKPRVFEPVRRALKYIGENSMTFMCFSHIGLYVGEFIVNRLPVTGTVHGVLYYILGTLAVVPIVVVFNKTKLHYIFGK